MSTLEEVAKDFYSGERRFDLHKINNITELENKYKEYLITETNNPRLYVSDNAPSFDEICLYLEKKIRVFRVKDNIEVLWQFLLPYDEFPKNRDEVFINNLINAIYILDNPAKKSKHSAAIKCLNIIKMHDTLLGELVGKYIILTVRGKNIYEKNSLKETILKALEHLTW